MSVSFYKTILRPIRKDIYIVIAVIMSNLIIIVQSYRAYIYFLTSAID
jgi:hypothetical protein